MWWIFVLTAVVVIAYLGRWIARDRDRIRVYRDRIESASDETE